ncbi:MAG: sialate O-acetylesterase, partial [Planctomycetota bacterium]
MAGSLSTPTPVEAGVRLPQVFADHMVLQRGRPIPIWGWAAPDADVSVSLAGQTGTA